ncbi:unnamed protein product [Auanema sp. JU1783]|nr:unnamed protein product [Auanema sp. JU1783]
MSQNIEATSIPLCSKCIRQISGEDKPQVTLCQEPFNCFLCFGLLDDSFIDEVASEVERQLTDLPYDASSFVLALNLPFSQTLRELILRKLRPDFNGILIDVPYKIRNIDAYLMKLSQNPEFHESDNAFLCKQFPNQYRQGKKRNNEGSESEVDCSKVQLQQIQGKFTQPIANAYKIAAPTKKCTFRLDFERDPVYIAGRYCKYSRNLPQSPWSTEEKGGFKEPGNSVSEKVCETLREVFGAQDTSFIASGREDIDVRMLGEGRPFAVELKNTRFMKKLRGTNHTDTLKEVENRINQLHQVVQVKYLTRVTKEQVDLLNIGQEEKRKLYTAYCYSTLKLSPESFVEAVQKIPLEVIQKTPVRVLKRRALLDRPRSIYTLELLRLDDHHFLARLETQAGTYIKEFVHGDFGRTQPSLADLLKVQNGEVDILELDVEQVDMEWPPKVE